MIKSNRFGIHLIEVNCRRTMQGKGISDSQAADLVAFLKTLKPPPPFRPAVSTDDAVRVEQGRRLFESLECNSCHSGGTLTSADTYNVGLIDKTGSKKFNPPSLRGVGHRYGLFHDKRAADIEAVVTRFRHQLPRALSGDEQQTLIRYLNSL